MRWAGVVAICILVSPPCSARDAATAVRHGQELTDQMVGPRAGGYEASPPTFAGGEIKDGKTYPFARAIARSARYGAIEISGPHMVIENARFSSSLDIYTALPIVLLGVSVRVEGKGVAAVLTRPGAGPFYALWSDFGAADGARVDAGIMLRADHATIYRSRISAAADGVSISGSHVVVTESVISTRKAEVGDHNDAVQMLGAPTDIALTRNRIVNANPQTSCVTVLGHDIRLDGNALSGGGWSLYGGARNNGKGGGDATRVRVSDTIFGRDIFSKGGSFGPVSYWDKANVWHNNHFSDGTPVTP